MDLFSKEFSYDIIFGMKTTLIIQARMGSNRLRGKSLMKVGSKLLIDHVVSRSLKVSGVDKVYLATTYLEEDNILVEHIKKHYQIDIYRGDPVDVRSRYMKIATKEKSDFIIRVTGDDPFKDPNQISLALNYLVTNKLDYVCNFEPRYLPIGMDFEIFSRKSLITSIRESTDLNDVEHVTWTMRSGNYRWESIKNILFQPNTRLTIDYEKDLEYCGAIANILEASETNYSWESTCSAILTFNKRRS